MEDPLSADRLPLLSVCARCAETLEMDKYVALFAFNGVTYTVRHALENPLQTNKFPRSFVISSKAMLSLCP